MTPDGLHAFGGVGIELEYMIVDAQTLSVRPIADRLLQAEGEAVPEIRRGAMGWSNELVLHLLEVKNRVPLPRIEPLVAAFRTEIAEIDRRLAAFGARLMPTAMHPWMDPAVETRLWPHAGAPIYLAYHRIFNARSHGWGNLQSMHLNLPFDGDAEFARVHAAARLVLPILPALAASSPIAEGFETGFADTRMEAYRTHTARVPSVAGAIVPDTAWSREGYAAEVLEPMYREVARWDPQAVLQEEWLNARGLIPRFDRSAVEIRVIDTQECPEADLAVAALAAAVVQALYASRWAPFAEQQLLPTARLADTLWRCVRDGEAAVLDDRELLDCFGYPGTRCEARELWQHLAAATLADDAAFGPRLEKVLAEGPLARRILRALDGDMRRARLREVYAELCDCLADGRMFEAGR